jgi:hypothetical protein
MLAPSDAPPPLRLVFACAAVLVRGGGSDAGVRVTGPAGACVSARARVCVCVCVCVCV